MRFDGFRMWRRGPMVARLVGLGGVTLCLGLLGGRVPIGGGGARLVATLLGLGLFVGVVAWLTLRRARTPVEVRVSARGLDVVATGTGERTGWAWASLSIRRQRDEYGETLRLDTPDAGTVLLEGPDVPALAEAIRARGGRVREPVR